MKPQMILAAFAALTLEGLAGYRIETFKPDIPYGPVPALTSVGMSLKDGLMLKNGKPYFWVGTGDGPAATQQGPCGLWLTWLQGSDAVTLDHGMRTRISEDPDGTAVVASSTDIGIQTWRREAVRLGLLTDFFHSWSMTSGRNKETKDRLERHPDLKEVVHDYGHYMGCDAGYPEGVDILVNRRAAAGEYIRRDPGTAYMELCREPGPSPANRRAYEGFRDYAKRKYGTIAEASRVWRIPYGSWDEVVPPHLDGARWKFNGTIAVYLRRLMLKREYPEIYWDWIGWMQQDLAKSVRDEIAALRARLPGVPFTIDVRGHTSRHDSYAAFVPEAIDPSEDLFSIHNTSHPFFYDGRPYDPATVTDTSTFPFLGMNYFRTNTKGAIINSEDIISVARTPASNADMMKANCLGRLVAEKWKFKEDPSGRGERGAYAGPDYDDSSWDDISVPGTWDSDPRHQGYGGVAWYRKTFTVPGSFRADHEDGSRIFRLFGRGVAQEGTVWLNGAKLGDVRGWSKQYSFDVGNHLRYGGKNVLVWRVNGHGKSENGLRFESYILAADMLSKPQPFNERQFRHLVFSQLFEGLSGVMVWHWHNDGLRAYQPKLHAQVETVAGAALPYLRHRRGKVAYLYPYRNQPGLPAAHEDTHVGYLDFACASEFLGHKPDVFGEALFRKEVTAARYPLLLVPYARFVEDETYAHFKRYVEEGGTAVVTDDSLARTYSRYAGTDIRTYAGQASPVTKRGKGRIVYIPGRPNMDALFPMLAPYMPEPEVRIASATKGERPLIERLFVGSDTRRTLYLCNWGGLDHALSVSLPDGCGDWQVTSVVGTFARGAGGKLSVTVPSGDVAIAILDRPGCERVAVKRVSPVRQRKFDELQAMLGRFVKPEESDVLFLRNSSGRGGFRMGAELLPEYVRAAEALGLKCAQSDPKTWTAETLRGRKLVVLVESNSNAFFKYDGKKAFWDMIEEYVKSGGSVLAVSAQSGTANVDGLVLRNASRFGVLVPWGSPFAKVGAAQAVFGDPYQFHADARTESPIVAEVGRVLTGVTRTMSVPKYSRKNPKPAFGCVPAVTVPADAETCAGGMVAATVEIGAGRMAFFTDALMFQPFRIEHDDNANLLVNTVGWLARRPVDSALRAKFRANLLLTEKDLKTIVRE